ncbi:MAG TPA: tetratricopeptide repeat protein [Gemmataceae bacterium]|nr:tetratricopeptide repeat protein [Gemmataceae bacterium]
MNENVEDLGGDLTDAAAAEYTALYQQGSDLVMKHINLDDREPAAAPAKEVELREGLRLLRKAVTIEPLSWPAHWLIGKGHQTLGEHERAYEAFRQATRLCKQNADVPREFCLECLHLGKFKEAVEAARLAVRVERSDPGLQANLALALLLAGDVEEALDQAEQAVARSPEDEINRNLLTIVQDVKKGRRPQPTTLAELEA